MIPKTSTTLLHDLAGSANHARWGEFIARYRPMMEAFLHARFPQVEADDVIQETLVALVKVLPDYRYDPAEKGAFHNYLTGILFHKALHEAAEVARRERPGSDLAGAAAPAAPDDSGEEEWRRAACEIAIGQLLADETIAERTRLVFRRVALDHEAPEAVAESLGMTRNAVDQIKSRMVAKLRGLVARLRSVL